MEMKILSFSGSQSRASTSSHKATDTHASTHRPHTPRMEVVMYVQGADVLLMSFLRRHPDSQHIPYIICLMSLSYYHLRLERSFKPKVKTPDAIKHNSAMQSRRRRMHFCTPPRAPPAPPPGVWARASRRRRFRQAPTRPPINTGGRVRAMPSWRASACRRSTLDRRLALALEPESAVGPPYARGACKTDVTALLHTRYPPSPTPLPPNESATRRLEYTRQTLGFYNHICVRVTKTAASASA